MKLASEQEVLELLSIRTTTQSTEAVEVALDTATELCASLIGVRHFNRETRQDRFRVDSQTFDLLGKGEVVDFYLTNAFLPEARIKVWQSSSSIPQTSNGTLLSRDAYLVDTEKGVVTMQGRWVDRLCTAMIRYDCGLDADSNGVYQNPPGWLKQAAISTVIEILRTHTVTANKKDYVTDMSNQLTRMFRTLLYANVRPRHTGVFPMHTEAL